MGPNLGNSLTEQSLHNYHREHGPDHEIGQLRRDRHGDGTLLGTRVGREFKDHQQREKRYAIVDPVELIGFPKDKGPRHE